MKETKYFGARICRALQVIFIRRLWSQCISWTGKMATGLRFEDRLEGASNFNPWKERIALLLEESELWDIVEKTQTIPTDAVLLVAYNEKNVKAKKSS
jgi:hypothetical protein